MSGRRRRSRRRLLGLAGLLVLAAGWASAAPAEPVSIPPLSEAAPRDITTADLIAVRDIDTLSVSPDGRRYAILVREADPAINAHRTGWFVGSVDGGALTFIGDGGEARLRESPTGRRVGYIIGSPGRWSPDGRWLAYSLLRDGEVQLWVASADGSARRQVTRHPADIRDFAWSEDGTALFFTAGTNRDILAARLEAERRSGILLDDFQFLSEIVYQARPDRPLETDLDVWVVAADGAGSRPASETERAAFDRARAANYSWGRSQPQGLTIADLGGSGAPPIAAGDGSLAWLTRVSPESYGPIPFLRLTASRSSDGADPISCMAAECLAQMFSKMWWSADGRHVIFWRKEDVNLVENSFYAWSPETGEVRRIFHRDGDEFRECELVGERLICAREMVDRPAHVAAIDVGSGEVAILADPNPEFRNLRLGAVERFEWDAPEDVHGIGYPRRMFGYVIYPPDFDRSRTYPVFIAPYGAPGFRRGDVGNEHPLFVYAASGIVVISAQFPIALGTPDRGMAMDLSLLYSPERDFPHLSMLAGSTFAALDAVAAMGFVDQTRVGIGGLSHGSFVPLFMLQHQDRLAAVSIAGGGWTQHEYYASTRNGRALSGVVGGWPESRDFWSRIDMSDHVETIEAPLLINFADREFFGEWRLPRSMENGERAFEAYIFPDELHMKWQPAHLFSIYQRNLDWFRFWLQDHEDPDPAKAAQYARWRQLREIQCRNPRSLRDYCG